MAITKVVRTALDINGNTPVVLTNSPAASAGDVLYAFITIDNTRTVTAPSGWSLVGNVDGGAGNQRIELWKKIAGASEGTTYSFAETVGGSITCITFFQLTGVDPAVQEDVALGTITNASTASLNAQAVTTVTDGCLILTAWLESGQANSITLSGGSIAQESNQLATGHPNAMSVGSEAQAAHGATGTRTGSWTGVTPGAALTLAVRPAASGGAPLPIRRHPPVPLRGQPASGFAMFARRRPLWGADVSAAIAAIADVPLRMRLSAPAWRDVPLRLRLSAPAWRDLPLRLRLSARSWRDLPLRLRLSATSWRDLPLRLRLSATSWRDLPLRLRLSAPSWRDLPLRLRLAATSWRDVPLRLRLSSSALRDLPLRLRLSAPAVRDLALRLRLSSRGFRDLALRVIIVAPASYLDQRLRLRLSARSWRDLPLRLRLVVAAARDLPLRLRLSAPSVRDLPLRVRLTAAAWRDLKLRLRLSAPAVRDVQLRLRLISSSTTAGYRDVTLRIVITAPPNTLQERLVGEWQPSGIRWRQIQL